LTKLQAASSRRVIDVWDGVVRSSVINRSAPR
jgi:hypothetical protein